MMGGTRQMKKKKIELSDAFKKSEEHHIKDVLNHINLPEPHRLGHMVLYTDYLSVVAELYAQVLTYQQLVDNLQKQNRFLMAKMQNVVDVKTSFNSGKDGDKH